MRGWMWPGTGSKECLRQAVSEECQKSSPAAIKGREKGAQRSRTAPGARVLLACLAASIMASSSAFVSPAPRALSLSRCSSPSAPSITRITPPFHQQGRRSQSKHGQARLGAGTAPLEAASREAQRSIGAEGVAVVTGGNRGIGFEVCRQLAGLGYTVVLAARSSSKGEAAARAIRAAGGDCRFLECDVSDARSVAAFAQRMRGEGLADVACLVNNAAIGLKTEPFSSASAQRIFDTNCRGALRVSRALLPMLRDGSRVVFVSSRSGAHDRLSPEKQEIFRAIETEEALEAVLALFSRDVSAGAWDSAGWPGAGWGLPPLPFVPAPVVLGKMWLRVTSLGLYFTSGPHHTAYCVSKAGMNAVARLLAAEASTGASAPGASTPDPQGDVQAPEAGLSSPEAGPSGRRIRFSACCPGWVRTDMAGPNAPSSIEQGAETPVWLATRDFENEDGPASGSDGPAAGDSRGPLEGVRAAFYASRARIEW